MVLPDAMFRNQQRQLLDLAAKHRLPAMYWSRELVGAAVLALTGRKEAQADLHAMGFDGVMVDPVDPFDLVGVVAAIIGGR